MRSLVSSLSRASLGSGRRRSGGSASPTGSSSSCVPTSAARAPAILGIQKCYFGSVDSSMTAARVTWIGCRSAMPIGQSLDTYGTMSSTQISATHVHTHAYPHLCPHVRRHVCPHAFTQASPHAYSHACPHIYIQAHTHAYTYLCTRLGTCLSTHLLCHKFFFVE